jgi:hypothetical protein
MGLHITVEKVILISQGVQSLRRRSETKMVATT